MSTGVGHGLGNIKKRILNWSMLVTVICATTCNKKTKKSSNNTLYKRKWHHISNVCFSFVLWSKYLTRLPCAKRKRNSSAIHSILSNLTLYSCHPFQNKCHAAHTVFQIIIKWVTMWEGGGPKNFRHLSISCWSIIMHKEISKQIEGNRFCLQWKNFGFRGQLRGWSPIKNNIVTRGSMIEKSEMYVSLWYDKILR